MEILRYTAFSHTTDGGNPAGVVLDATGADDLEMQRVAAEVGYSETAFLLPSPHDAGSFGIRYFSPLAEVPFCGHATIATAVAYAEAHGPGRLRLDTRAGEVVVATTVSEEGEPTATLTSVTPATKPLPDETRQVLLEALGWAADDLDADYPSLVAFAGAWHPVLFTRTHARLHSLDYDFARLGTLMPEQGWTTVNLVWRESAAVFHARNPFPPGGVVEDPATGAAAAALGGYLRAIGTLPDGGRFVVHQGVDLGRPSLLTVHVPAAGGIEVSGTATRIAPSPAGRTHE